MLKTITFYFYDISLQHMLLYRALPKHKTMNAKELLYYSKCQKQCQNNVQRPLKRSKRDPKMMVSWIIRGHTLKLYQYFMRQEKWISRTSSI